MRLTTEKCARDGRNTGLLTLPQILRVVVQMEISDIYQLNQSLKSIHRTISHGWLYALFFTLFLFF